MSTDPTAAELLAEVDADPDAVVAAYGAESSAELIASGGDHDVIPDERLDVDDPTASELFADLAATADEVPPTTSRATAETDLEPATTDEAVDPSDDLTSPTDLAAEVPVDAVVLTEPTRCVEAGDGATIETLFSDAAPTAASSRDGVELVGPGPRVERFDSDVFGAAGLEDPGRPSDGAGNSADDGVASTDGFQWVRASGLEPAR